MSRSMPFPAERLRAGWRYAARMARAAIGLPDYDTYVSHVRAHHPDQVPMDRDTFFRERMAARYGRGRSRCC